MVTAVLRMVSSGSQQDSKDQQLPNYLRSTLPLTDETLGWWDLGQSRYRWHEGKSDPRDPCLARRCSQPQRVEIMINHDVLLRFLHFTCDIFGLTYKSTLSITILGAGTTYKMTHVCNWRCFKKGRAFSNIEVFPLISRLVAEGLATAELLVLLCLLVHHLPERSNGSHPIQHSKMSSSTKVDQTEGNQWCTQSWQSNSSPKIMILSTINYQRTGHFWPSYTSKNRQ